ncbi:MAG: hypothetical protein QM774_13600 [Gordonia sp. (in: high G+C Gram-positive bacteria)]
MTETAWAVLYILLMGTVIVGLDFAFLRDRFWARLATNVAIVLCSRPAIS